MFPQLIVQNFFLEKKRSWYFWYFQLLTIIVILNNNIIKNYIDIINNFTIVILKKGMIFYITSYAAFLSVKFTKT